MSSGAIAVGANKLIMGTRPSSMRMKQAAAAVGNGADVIIANGKHPEMIYDIVKGGRVGTLFVGKKAE